MTKPHATVAIIVEQNDRYLMVLEYRDDRWVYNQPAGHIEMGEGILEAAIRETLEETAWQVEPIAVSGISILHAPNNITYIRTTLIAIPIRHFAQQPLDTGIDSAVWLSYEELLEKRNQLRSPIVLKVIEDYRRGIQYPLDMIYHHR
jgi:8-oxo-dGTP pyrophosphatase MutT (NUDIX family)